MIIIMKMFTSHFTLMASHIHVNLNADKETKSNAENRNRGRRATIITHFTFRRFLWPLWAVRNGKPTPVSTIERPYESLSQTHTHTHKRVKAREQMPS